MSGLPAAEAAFWPIDRITPVPAETVGIAGFVRMVGDSYKAQIDPAARSPQRPRNWPETAFAEMSTSTVPFNAHVRPRRAERPGTPGTG